MSTIQDVRAAEKKMKDALTALRAAGLRGSEDLSENARKATDEFAKVVRELDRWSE